MREAIPVEIGPMLPTDRNFVLSSLKLSQQAQQTDVPRGRAFDRLNRDADRLFARPGVRVLVARSPSNPDFVFGYVVYEVTPQALVVDFAYTKSDYRRLGIARDLLAAVLAEAPDLDTLVTSYQGGRFGELIERYGFARLPMPRRLALEAAE